MKKISLIFCFVITIFMTVLSACNTAKDITEPKNPIFSGTALIDVYSPVDSTDKDFPDFTWTSTGLPYEVAGLFSKPIRTSGLQIDNTSDCFAMWTTGLSGSAGKVPYSNFRKVVNGELTETPVDALTNGTYYWAVWAYTAQMTLTNSSSLITFTK